MNFKAVSLSLLSTLFISNSAFAQTTANATVNFNGFIPSYCQFSNIVSGELVESSATLVTSTPGQITLTCNSSTSTLDISSPIENSNNPILANNINYSGLIGTTNISSTNLPTNNIPIGNSIVPISLGLTVSNFVGSPSTLPSGTYNYQLQLTANTN